MPVQDGVGNYIISSVENAADSADRMLGSMRKAMNNLILDWEKISCFKVDNANCDF